MWEGNYASATGASRHLVEDQIKEELANGRYQIATSRPSIVSALGAIPKPDGASVRIIHDCSRPQGNAVNDLAVGETFRYQSIQDATDLITEGCMMAKVDLKSAYRSVKIHPDDYNVSGLAWTFKGDKSPTVMTETRLPFGSSLAPSVFNHLSQAVRRMMGKAGYLGIVAYLDDFLIIEKSKERCIEAMNYLISLLRRLGFAINYSKVEGPKQCITFLGIELDSTLLTLSLPDAKVGQLLVILQEFNSQRSVSKKDIQRLTGRLNWAAQVIYGGRPHLRRLLDRQNNLQAPNHRTRITRCMRADITWWISFLRVFNGSTPMLDARPRTPTCIDACTEGGGGFFNGAWFHVSWANWPGASARHINYKEVLALEPAAYLWAPHWRNHKVTIHSDNQAAVSMINKGSAKDPFTMASLRRVFWLSAIFNFRLTAVYYPGRYNTLADAASRLHEPGGWRRLSTLLSPTQTWNFANHYEYFRPHRRPAEERTGHRSRGLQGSILGPSNGQGLQGTLQDVPQILQQDEHSTSTSSEKGYSQVCSLSGQDT